jgi:RTA1 like protein
MADTYIECRLGTCDIEDSIYSYQPSLSANIAFAVLFGITGIAHVVQGVLTKKRAFWIATAIGCAAEVGGYAGRILSHYNPWADYGFLTQICCLTIAPAFFAAAIYFTLGDIVRAVSLRSSRIRPAGYAAIFIPCDVISLILQGTGGGMASVTSQNGEDPVVGTNIMVAGLSFQVASMTFFIILALEYAWRVRRFEKDTPRLPVSKLKLALFVAFFSLAVICIFIRCVYRVIELSQGWEGDLIKNETIFIVLEGV